VGVEVGVDVDAGVVVVLLEGTGLEGVPLQLVNTTVKTKKEMITDTIDTCLIITHPL
jgi:hypothetical protein